MALIRNGTCMKPHDPNRFLPEIVGAIIGGVFVVLIVVYVLLQLAQRH